MLAVATGKGPGVRKVFSLATPNERTESVGFA